MYRIRSLSGDKWSIADERDRALFIGTKRQCEDWLDQMENMQAPRQTVGGWLIRVLRMLHLTGAPKSAPSESSSGPVWPPRLAS